jgi:hypothetical protein
MRRIGKATFNLAAVALALALVAAVPAASPAAAAEPTLWLHVEVNSDDDMEPEVRIQVPLSLIEIVIDSVDKGEIFSDLRADHGIDLRELWAQLRDADTDEFIRVEDERARIKVHKDASTLRVTVQERGHDEPNVRVQVPFEFLDYLLETDTRGFKLSEMLRTFRGSLPLVLVEAQRDHESVKVWVEQD